MARGTAVGEPVVSQARTPEFDAGYDRAFGPDRKPERGRWVMVDGKLVSAEDYRPPARAVDAPIIADRIHEGTTLDVGDRIVDIGSRRKRRQFMRETGLVESSDCSKAWLAKQAAEKDKRADRATDNAFEQAARKLYNQGKLRD